MIRELLNASRFYCCGVELANAFHELRDPNEQRRRFASSMREQQRIFGVSYPIDEDFLAALARYAGRKRRRAGL